MASRRESAQCAHRAGSPPERWAPAARRRQTLPVPSLRPCVVGDGTSAVQHRSDTGAGLGYDRGCNERNRFFPESRQRERVLSVRERGANFSRENPVRTEYAIETSAHRIAFFCPHPTLMTLKMDFAPLGESELRGRGSATRLAGLVRVLCVHLPAAVPFPCASDDSADVFGGARDLQRRRARHLFTTPSGVRPRELGRKVAAGSALHTCVSVTRSVLSDSASQPARL